MRSVLSIGLMTICLAVPVSAQETRPADELAKENRELKAYIEKLEKRLAELQAKAENRFELPELRLRNAQPYVLPRLTPPIPTPTPDQVRPRAIVPSTPPSGARSYRFNGQDVWIVPLKQVAAEPTEHFSK